MSTFDASDPSAAAGPTAGQMLRAAREAKGLHLAVLSVHLKVSVRQLEALEADDHAHFKGVAFERALAQSVCRQLGIDPVPVLAALPHAAPVRAIEPVGLHSRRPAVTSPPRNNSGKGLSRQVLVLAVLMLLGAAALVWWPSSERKAEGVVEEMPDPAQAAVPMGQASDPMAMVEPASAASAAASTARDTAPPAVPAAPTPAASAGASVALPSAQPASSARPAAPVPSAAAAPAAADAAHSLTIRLRADAWIEVRDSQGQMPVKRTVKAGETLALSPSAPLFVYVGKADSAELRWQGQAVDLQPHARNNEARLQLKP
ncbi:MAG: hypothetical protein RL559_1695 [Pseudomonadota bacterium]|jgi:cytoskeleton protein RodZ